MTDAEQIIEQRKTAVRTFLEAEIDFVLIGGFAMIAHGASAITRDIDIAYAAEATNLERLAALLPKVHARVLGRPANDGFVVTAQTLQRVRFLNLYTDIGELDVMREVPGVESFDGLRERALLLDIGGFAVRVASIDDLISMKRAANRPKDQPHLNELLTLKKLTEEAAE